MSDSEFAVVALEATAVILFVLLFALAVVIALA